MRSAFFKPTKASCPHPIEQPGTSKTIQNPHTYLQTSLRPLDPSTYPDTLALVTFGRGLGLQEPGFWNEKTITWLVTFQLAKIIPKGNLAMFEKMASPLLECYTPRVAFGPQ